MSPNDFTTESLKIEPSNYTAAQPCRLLLNRWIGLIIPSGSLTGILFAMIVLVVCFLGDPPPPTPTPLPF